MRFIVTAILATLLVSCTDPVPRDDDRQAALAGQDLRDRDRLCRIYAEEGRPDPTCPEQPVEPGPRSSSQDHDPLRLPPVPEPSLPR